jgi:hypothetical protein
LLPLPGGGVVLQQRTAYNNGMARREQDREDLLAEATALVERAALQLPAYDEPVVVGFRRDQSASFYFGADPVYQFTQGGLLRRAFVDGQIYKAEGGGLLSLERRRGPAAVELVRHELTDADETAFLVRMRSHFDVLGASWTEGRVRVMGQVPPDVDVIARVRNWLNEFGGKFGIADSPRAG